MDKCRVEFEAWYERYCTDNGFNCNLQIMSTCSYLNSFSEMCFIGWKASRESMKAIKLPEATFETPSGDNALREDAVIETITSAGYEVE